jgi:serine/threonine-protein kinase RsbW
MARDADGSIRLSIPGALAYRDVAVRVVGTACRLLKPRAGTSDSPPAGAASGGESGRADFANDEFAMQVVSAFGEAYNNVTIHGYADGPAAGHAQRIDLLLRAEDDVLVVEMTDWGKTHDPASYATPPDELPERGMGLFIMRSCMDEIAYVSGPPNTLILKKRWR